MFMGFSKEEELKKIQKVIDGEGVKNLKELAYKIRLEQNQFYGLLAEYSLTKEVKSRIREKKLKAIQEARSSGARTVTDVANKSGLTYSQICNLLSEEDKKSLMHNIVTNRIKTLNQALEERVNSIEELCKRAKLDPQKLYEFSMKYRIPIPFDDMIPYCTWPEIDPLIKKGVEQKQIGDIVGRSREFIRQYIKGSGQYKIWKNTKDPKRKREQAYDAKIEDLYNKVYAVAGKRTWQAKKTIEYIESFERQELIRIDTAEITEALKRFKAAERSGKQKSLEQLTEGLGLHASSLGIILKRVGEKPTYGARERHPTPKCKKDEMKALFFSGAKPKDVARSLKFPYSTVAQNFVIWRKRYGEQPQNNV